MFANYWDDNRCTSVGLAWIQHNLGLITSGEALPDTVTGVEAQRARELEGEEDEHHIECTNEVADATLRWLKAAPEERLHVVQAALAACEEFMSTDDTVEAFCGVWSHYPAPCDALKRRMSDAASAVMTRLCLPEECEPEPHTIHYGVGWCATRQRGDS